MHHQSSQLSLRASVSTRSPNQRTSVIHGRGNRSGLAGGHDVTESLASYSQRWLASIRSGVRPRTFESYDAQLRLHVLPLLGDRPVADLDVEDVLALIDVLRSKGCESAERRRFSKFELGGRACESGHARRSPGGRAGLTKLKQLWPLADDRDDGLRR